IEISVYKRGDYLMEIIKSSPNRTEEEQLDFYEHMFNALADKIRLKILHSIRQSDSKSLCVCDLEELLALKQSKLSYHLKKLVEISVYKRGDYLMEIIKSSPNRTEEEQLDFYEHMFNALADKIRLKILHSIRQSDSKSLCVCDLEELLASKQSKLSYHLKKLV